MDYDIFNGDADGICALLQLRLAEPRDSKLVTGVKRDINLMDKIEPGAGDRVTVLDVSMDKNSAALHGALDAGAEVFYVDHHFPGDIPEHDGLTAMINEAADVCTAILVNGHLQNSHIQWAIAGAFGDNLHASARSLAAQTNLGDDDIGALENLGTYINYNGYGPSLDDLHFRPADLYRTLYTAADPLEFVSNSADFRKLQDGYNSDMGLAADLAPALAEDKVAMFILPDEAWARRVSGVYSNDLATGHPDRAHAVLTEKANGNYLVSVRAPLSNKQGAVDLCRQFPTGGGRAAAAGINDLEKGSLDAFIDAFRSSYG